MQQFRLMTQIGAMPIVAGQFGTLDVPRQYDLETLGFRISATLNVTGAATAVRAEAPTQLVTRIELTSDGKNTHANMPFWALSVAKYDRPIMQAGARVITPPTSPAVAAYAVEAYGFLDLCNIDGVRPKDSNLRTAGMSLFQLRATFGNPGDCFVGGVVSFTGNPVLEVFEVQCVEVPDAAGAISSPGMLKKQTYQEVNVAANNPNLEIKLPAGNLIKALVVRAEGGLTLGEPSNAVINALVAQSGQDVRFKLSGNQIRALAAANYGQVAAGLYILDFTSQGNTETSLSDCWDVRGQVEPKLIADVTLGAAATRLQVVTTEMIPSRA